MTETELLQSFDAKDWAREFCRIAKGLGHDIDEGWMITWFANAIMKGWDERGRQTCELCGRNAYKELMARVLAT